MTIYHNIQAKPVAGALGAEIEGANLSKPLDDQTLNEIKQAFVEYLVLFFRDQNLKPEEQKTFAGYFGELKDETMLMGGPGGWGVDRYVFQPEYGQTPGAPATRRLHVDHSYADIPNKLTVLQALICPDAGGDTLWVSAYAAYDALSDSMKVFLEGLTGLFPTLDKDRIDRLVTSGPEALESLKVRREPAEHPLVFRHPETGKKALFMDFLRMWSIKQLTNDESRTLIDFLEKHCAKPEFQCRYHWQPGSVAIWDNIGTSHKFIDDVTEGRRKMQTVRVEGTERPTFQ